jgi:hypothetical protein
MRFGRKRDRLERRLEAERPQPPDEFVSRLAGRLTPPTVRRRSGWQIAFAASLTTLLAAAFALTGGIGYAANAVEGGTTAVTSLVTGPSNKPEQSNADSSSAVTSSSQSTESSSQASDNVAVCHIPPGNPDNAHTIVVDESAVETHLNHGDTLGPCPEDGGPPDDQYSEKVLICHIPPGNPDNAHTISVSVNAVPTHLAHGDTEGPCED